MNRLSNIVPHLRRLLAPQTGDDDAALVARFAASRDEIAFAELVRRHGPLVRGVCRRALGPDADDAFQATFLVLARKAGSIRRPAAVGSWLYGVAYRLSRRAQTAAARRARYERAAVPAPPQADPANAAAWADLLAILDDELARLPDRLRAPLLLCYIEGRTQDESARQLRWSLGTFRRRLDRARHLLRVRMERRGATLSGGLFATLLAADAVTAAVPGALARATSAAAMTYLTGGTVAPGVVALANGGLSMLAFPKLKALAAAAVVVGGLSVGAGVFPGPDAPKPAAPTPPAPAPDGDRTLPAGVVARFGTAKFHHGAAIHAIHITPDGVTILTQGDRAVRLWDAKTGADLGAIPLPDGGAPFWTSSLTPDGRTLITTRRNGTAQVWDVAGRKLVRSFRLAEPPFEPFPKDDTSGWAHAVHAPDGSAIAVVTPDGSLRVCDIARGEERQELRTHSDLVRAAVFTPDSKTLLLASDRGPRSVGAGNLGTLLPWDPVTGQPGSRSCAIPAGAGNLAVSPDGSRAALAVPETKADAGDAPGPGRGPRNAPPRPRQQIVVVSLDPTRGPAVFLGGFPFAVDVLAFTPDGKYLVAPDGRSDRRSLVQWDLSTSRAIREYLPLAGPTTALAFAPDGRMVSADDRLHFWDWKTGKPVGESPAATDPTPTPAFVIAPDSTAVVAPDRTALVVFDLKTGQVTRRYDVPNIEKGATVELRTFAVANNGSRLAAAVGIESEAESTQNIIVVWDVSSGRPLHRIPDPYPTQTHLAFSPDGQALIASASKQAAVRWELTEGNAKQADLPNPVFGVVRAVTNDPPALLFEAGSTVSRFGPAFAVLTRFRLDGRREADPGDFLPFDQALKSDARAVAGMPGGPAGGGRGGAGRGRAGGGFDQGGGMGGGSGHPHIAYDSGVSHVALTFMELVAKKPRIGQVTVVSHSGELVGKLGKLDIEPSHIALSAGGALYAVIGEGAAPTAAAWDVKTGREVGRFRGLSGRATGLAFTPDGNRLVARGSDGTFVVWAVGDAAKVP